MSQPKSRPKREVPEELSQLDEETRPLQLNRTANIPTFVREVLGLEAGADGVDGKVKYVLHLDGTVELKRADE